MEETLEGADFDNGADLTAGPWPRTLTFEEIERFKARALLVIEHRLEEVLLRQPMNLGDAFTVNYTLRCGIPAEVEAAKAEECGAVPPDGGPACRLDRGHSCEHSSVKRW